jgi:Kef-type K+ transport system membrane component KefB
MVRMDDFLPSMAGMLTTGVALWRQHSGLVASSARFIKALASLAVCFLSPSFGDRTACYCKK